MGLAQEFTKGLWKELPPFRLVLGLCPTLAVTTAAKNGIGMGLAVTFVLVCSNILVSALRKIIPGKVRIAGLYRHHRFLRGHCRIDDAGLFLQLVPGARHFYSVDRGQLYHLGTGRSLCLQERCHAIHYGWSGDRDRLHPGSDVPGIVAGDRWRRNVVWRPYFLGKFPAHGIHA